VSTFVVATMSPVRLRDLVSAGFAEVEGREVSFTIQQQWCAAGERRLGYPGIVRLVECVRENHFQSDIATDYPGIDTITKSLDFEFEHPLIAGSKVTGEYAVSEIGARSYKLEVTLREVVTAMRLARGRMISVFYEEANLKSIAPPASLIAALQARSSV
jgi:acyl-CoA thioesterase FadM